MRGSVDKSVHGCGKRLIGGRVVRLRLEAVQGVKGAAISHEHLTAPLAVSSNYMVADAVYRTRDGGECGHNKNRN